MDSVSRLGIDFFSRNTLIVARDLIGMRLVRCENGRRLAGYINETEAYIGEDDLGCHAHVGLTNRTRVMYGRPGVAYVYFTYGMHWMLNFVCANEGFPAAVLIRGLKACEGLDLISMRRRNQPISQWTNGPAKICQAFDIDGSMNAYDICQLNPVLYVESDKGKPFVNYSVTTGSRVGLNSVPEPWKSMPWRFTAKSI